ncbi:MAG: 3-dehydroquinate synthase [Roseiflexaceae bacterium]|nr:3-dehydroquinate synthase [Roseiflexaceae bacterium]
MLIGPGLLDSLPEHLARLGLTGRVWLIADAAIYAGQAVPLLARLHAAGLSAQGFAVPSGEQSKNLAVAAELYSWLIGGGVERRDAVLALGGGVTGDLAGFVAATTLRGLALVQLPTTLLAMVDSALGGKTGVNHPLGKNLIGAFHQPRLVLADVRTLATLPPRELRAGWAEVIKHGVIWDAGLFEELEGRQIACDDAAIGKLIRRAAAVKVAVVNIDEREQAERMLLNYGHTLGHAIEAAAGYGAVLHGEAVAIGMELAARIALGMGMFSQGELERQRSLLHKNGLSTAIPAGLADADLLERTLRDKKVKQGTIHWVLPVRIGAAVVRSDVPDALVAEVVAKAARTTT